MSENGDLLKLECLNNNYSTTRLCYKLLDDKCLDENGKIKKEYKFTLNFPEFGIADSKIPAKENEKFDTYLFLPKGENRKGEGGLRTKGYFKFSYENLIMNDECLILNDENGNEFRIDNSKLISNNSTFNIQHSTLNKLPLISIITVVYNGAKYLEETIQSVINQTYPNVEYIIIDGGSTDGTLDIIKKYEDKIDYWISEKDRGIYDAMNKGIMLSKGEYIGILNSDDYLVENALESNVFKILHKKCDYVIGNVKFTTGGIIRPIIPLENKIYQEMPYPHVSALIPLYVYKNVGLFDSNYKIAGDHDMAVRIIVNEYKYCYNDEIIAYIEPGGVSSDLKGNVESLQVALKHKKNPIKAYNEFFVQILKFCLIKIFPEKLLNILKKMKGSRFV